MAHSDPEAAAVLMVQLTTSAPAALGQALGVREGYNPIRLYAIIAERCHWTIAEIRKTDYRTLWGIMRELVLLDREREKAKGTPSPTLSDTAEIFAAAHTPVKYTAEG